MPTRSSTFIEAMASGKAPQPSGRDGLAALLLADAALKSVKDGKAVKVAALD